MKIPRMRLEEQLKSKVDDTLYSAKMEKIDAHIDELTTALEAAQAGYRLGNRTILDVIDAQITLVQRRADRKQAWYDHALARLRLRQAAGVLDFNELARINARLRGAPEAGTTG